MSRSHPCTDSGLLSSLVSVVVCKGNGTWSNPPKTTSATTQAMTARQGCRALSRARLVVESKAIPLPPSYDWDLERPSRCASSQAVAELERPIWSTRRLAAYVVD